MNRAIDDLGRIVLPAEMRKELGIEPNQELKIELIGNKIMISNPGAMKTKAEVEKMYKDICNLENRGEYDKGFEDALKMVLNK